MIQVPMTAASLAASRFAVSRMSETVDGLRALADPTHAAHLQRWLRWVRPRLRGLDLSLLDIDYDGASGPMSSTTRATRRSCGCSSVERHWMVAFGCTGTRCSADGHVRRA